jgi:hypothetical protein
MTSRGWAYLLKLRRKNMADHKREIPKAAQVSLGGIVLALSGGMTLLAAAIRARADYPDTSQDIPSSVLLNLDTVTGKLGISGMIIVGAGIAIMIAGLIYAEAKELNSSTAAKIDESGNQTPAPAPLSINSY